MAGWRRKKGGKAGFENPYCGPSNYMAIDQNTINSIFATTDNYKFSHKHIKPTLTGNLLIDTHNMTHLCDRAIFV